MGDDKQLHCTNGHCRLAAVEVARSEGAEILTVPVRLEDRYSNEEDRTMSLITRNSGRNLSQLELGAVFKRLLSFGWTVQKLGEKTAFSSQHIRNILTVAGAPKRIIDMVKDGKVSPSLASKTINEEGGEEATKTLQQAVKGAETEGKKKATQKDVNTVKNTKTIPWKTYGPRLRSVVSALYDNGDFDMESVEGDLLELSNVLEEIEEKYGAIENESPQVQRQLPV